MFSNKFWLIHNKKKTATHRPYIFFTSSFIYTSDGRIGQFLLKLWVREDDKYKTRVLNGPINLTACPSYILVRPPLQIMHHNITLPP